MSKRSGDRERSASTGSQPHSPVNDAAPKSSTKPRDRAPSFASMASGTQPRVLNEKVSVVRLCFSFNPLILFVRTHTN